MELIAGWNIVDWICAGVLALSVLYGLYRGFINGVLSLAALVGAIAGSFFFYPKLAEVLSANETLVATLMYYTDAASRIGRLDLTLMTVSETTGSALAAMLENAKLPEAFRRAFLANFENAAGGQRVSDVLSRTIVNASISILSFLICFFVCYLVALFLIHLISYVFELPVLRHLDSLVGGAFGFIRGWLLLMVLFILVPIVLAVAPVDSITNLLETSKLAPYFDSRLILTVLGVG
ncbi:MAG: CvpA family protein [Clostridiales bacterium]|nr:CvpA family protein [Clostridiales bacterium]